MVDFVAQLTSSFASYPGRKAPAGQYTGKIRIMEWVFVAPLSGTAPAIDDRIIWGALPTGVRTHGFNSKLQWSTGTASCTLNLGDNIAAARHLAATAITTAGTATPSVVDFVKTGTCSITTGLDVVNNVFPSGATHIGDLFVATGVPTGTRVIEKTGNQIRLSAAATATTDALAFTSTGGFFRTSKQGANVDNAWVSSTDDSTLISVVAGAQIANNQVLKLAMEYSET